MLKQIFDSFDLEKKGEINVEMIGQILDMLGHQLNPDELSVRQSINLSLNKYLKKLFYIRKLSKKLMKMEME